MGQTAMAANAPVIGQTQKPRRGMADQVWMSAAREMLNRQSALLLVYLLVTDSVGCLFGVMAQMEWNAVFDPVRAHSGFMYIIDHAEDEYGGIINLVASCTALCFLVFTRRRQICNSGPLGIFHTDLHPMTWQVLLGCFALTLTGQTLGDWYQSGMDWTAARLGVQQSWTTTEQIQQASGTIPMFIYAGLLAPIIEELVFRGAIMHALKPYGHVFAIVTSAVMFGFFHGDLGQGFFAFIMGLLLGYLACEYSIFWSIALHMFNNLVVSDGLEFLLSFMSDNMSSYVIVIMMLAGMLAAILVLYLGRHRIAAFLRNNRTYTNVYGAWACPFFIFFLLIMGLTMLIPFVPTGA
ncbi:MAG: CPBP family glutamic-type intramembrane protease [Bifidobacterium sp.]|uniref:CPBP family intramembrane glutamic endopeptidase n=1 Tax=Bifidobacterium apicola TaxID=3230739 RepID=UPI0036F1CB99|nr:CPBP family glutamic-type intramembrane protease [Bifidobacterium sp.]